MFIFDTIGSFCGVLTTFFVGGTVVWLFIGVDAPAMFSFLMPSDRVMEFDDFLLEELRLVVYLELVIVGPQRKIACASCMALRWFYSEYCNL